MTPISQVTSSSARSQRGFTLVELTVVLSVFAVTSSLLVLSVDGMLPKYRLRAAARSIGSAVRQWRQEALTAGAPMRIFYIQETGQYGPRPDPSKPPTHSVHAGVRISSVKIAGQEISEEAGLHVSASGTMLPLELKVTDGERTIAVKFHPLLNKVTYE